MIYTRRVCSIISYLMLEWRQSFRVFYDNNWTYGSCYVGLSAAYRVNDRFTVFGTYEMICDKENNKQNVITAGLSCRLSVDFASNPSPTRDYENGSTDNVHSSRTDQQSIQLLFSGLLGRKSTRTMFGTRAAAISKHY